MQRRTTGRRVGLSLIATVLAVALVLTGTFAWQSINQQALNPAHGWDRYEETPLIAGGRLHDHFEVVSDWTPGAPANKDVFVENFREDGEDIFTRIRLTEFMMINEVSLITGATYDDLTSWTPRLTSPGTTNVLTDFWHWELGGRTDYIPTFNRDYNSRETDTRGAAIDPQWTTAGIGADLGAVSSLSTRRAVDLNWPSVTPPANSATWQPFPAEAGGENGASWTGTEHNAAIHNGTTFLAPTTVGVRTNMPNATGVMTYAAWSQLAVEDQVGPFWVVDPAGWAYWMLPVPAQTSTGLLLDQIELRTDTVGSNTLIASDANPEIDWWYGIHVTAEMALADNWNLWDTEGAGMTPEGVRIMQRATEPAPPDFIVDVDVDNEGNVTVTVTPDDNYDVSVDNGNIIVTLPDAEPGDDIQVNLPPGGGWTSTPGTDGDGNVIITITPPPGYEVVEQPPGSGNIVLRPTTVFFTVIFDLAGGTMAAPSTQEVAQGQLATAPTPPPTRGEDIFLGWFYGADTTPFDFTTPINASGTLTARWTSNTILPTNPGLPENPIILPPNVEDPENGRGVLQNVSFLNNAAEYPFARQVDRTGMHWGSIPLEVIFNLDDFDGVNTWDEFMVGLSATVVNTAGNTIPARFLDFGQNQLNEPSFLYDFLWTQDCFARRFDLDNVIFAAGSPTWYYPFELTLTRDGRSVTLTFHATNYASLISFNV